MHHHFVHTHTHTQTFNELRSMGVCILLATTHKHKRATNKAECGHRCWLKSVMDFCESKAHACLFATTPQRTKACLLKIYIYSYWGWSYWALSFQFSLLILLCR